MSNSIVASKDQTAISFIKEKFCSTPLSLIYKLFRKKKVIINSVPIRYYHHRIKKGSIIKILDSSIVTSQKKNFIKPPVKPEVYFDIVYEDDNIIIVLKDHWIETHNKFFPSLSLDNAVSYYLKNNPKSIESINDEMIISSSHRIDKLTKGLVVYAKNTYSKKLFHKLFGEKQSIEKKYIAVCKSRSVVNEKIFDGVIQGYIYKDEINQKMIFSYTNEMVGAKECSMLVKKIFSKDRYYIFEVTLLSGRKHQIRSFMHFIGAPIVGDEKYGSDIKMKNKIKLFAYKIEFLKMPNYFKYLDGMKFEIPKIKKLLISQVSSSNEGVLPKKFIKY